MRNVHERHNFESWEKCPIEQVHLQFCKHLLGVNRSAANLMYQAELGCLPLKIASDLKVANFAKHYESMPLDDLTSLSMQLDCQLYQQNNCIPSLSCFISDLKDMHGDQFMTITKKKQKVEIIQNYRNIWECSLLALGTGQSYYKFKNTIRLEPYLTVIKNQKQCVSYTKLRLCDHKLRIEADQYLKFKVVREQRICYLCHTKVEDEIIFCLSVPNWYNTTNN